MSVYLVTWDLNKEGSAYTQARSNLMSAINDYDNNYNSSLDSVRFVATEDTADEVYKDLMSLGKLDSNDTIVVTKMERSTALSQGNLGKNLWSWINARV